MGMLSRVRRTIVVGSAVAAAVTASLATAPAASADPDLPLNQNVEATTHLATLDRDLANTGTFVGSVDLATGEIVGDLALEATETELDLLGLPAATVGVQVAPTGPNHGQVNFSDFTLTMTSNFNIKILYIKPLGLDINLVGDKCQTRTPVNLEMTGTINPADLVTTLSGTFEIPKFGGCGLATLGLNLLVPGPGNTFSSVATPA